MDELHQLLIVIESKGFTQYSKEQTNRSKYAKLCLGRDEASADYVHYCPDKHRIISTEEFVAKRHAGNPVHPGATTPGGTFL